MMKMKRQIFTINGTIIRRRIQHRMYGFFPARQGRFFDAYMAKKQRQNGVGE